MAQVLPIPTHASRVWGHPGLRFGNGVAGNRTTLFFSAGIGGEAHGLLGSITVTP